MGKINFECSIVRKEDIDRTLATPPVQGKNLLEPLRTIAVEHNLPFKILEDYEVINQAEIHKKEGDLWQCLEGEVVFTCGGELIEPRIKTKKDGLADENELVARGISGGSKVIVKPGDWLWIPAGVPHQHQCEGTARLVIIKIPFNP